MKLRKKTAAIFLSVIMAVLIAAATVSAQAVVTVSDGTFTYVYQNDVWQLYGYLGSESEITLPESYAGTPVTSIADRSFLNSSVTSVVVPDSYTSVGSYAFYSCKDLKQISLPETISLIGMGAFAKSGLIAADLSETKITAVPSYLFTGCASLESVLLPNNVENVGEAAFAETALTSLEIPSSVTVLGYTAFANTESLEKVTLHEGLKSIGESCFENSALGTINLPETLESIGASAFRGNSSLKTLYIPDSVTSIGAYALYPMSVQGLIEVKCFENSYAADYCYENFVMNTKSYQKLFGDANLDGLVTINDVTSIQRHCAEMDTLQAPEIILADADKNGIVGIEDATLIQRYLAEYDDAVL